MAAQHQHQVPIRIKEDQHQHQGPFFANITHLLKSYHEPEDGRDTEALHRLYPY